ncbi:MAG: hypothetical protein U7127_12910 [Phormidium sp.]
MLLLWQSKVSVISGLANQRLKLQYLKLHEAIGQLATGNRRRNLWH